MNRKHRCSVRPQQTFYQHLEGLRNLEIHERPHHHASNPFVEAEPESSGDGNNTTAIDYRVSTSRPRRIGAGTWLIIATSLSASIASLTFLSWLWFVDRQNESWRHLVLTGRATQSITLMCVLIRWSIGSLAAITTSMAASISAEFHGIPKLALAEVSIARFTNNGPQSFKKLLPGTALRGWIKVCMAILFVLVAASQFSSTLLVADLQFFQLTSFPKHISYRYRFRIQLHNPEEDMSEDPLSETDDEWSRAPMQSPIFAEYLEPGQLKDNIDDTGQSLRAFPPFYSQSQRESIHSFNAMARIIDTRFICIRPKFTIKFPNAPADDLTDMDNSLPYLEANITADLSNVPQLYHAGHQPIIDRVREYSGFAGYTFPDPQDIAPTRVWILRRLETTGDTFWLKSPLRKLEDAGAAGTDAANPSILATMTLIQNEGEDLQWGENTTWEYVNSSEFGPWTQQFGRVKSHGSETQHDCEIRMSLCFDALAHSPISYLNITASTIFNHTEPTIGYDFKTLSYDTLAIRNQLGAVSREEKERSPKREIFEISKQDLNRSLESYSLDTMSILFTDTPYLYICIGGCVGTSSLVTGAFTWQVFNDVLNSTGSPALALRTIFTLAMRMAYYNYMPTMTPEDDLASITTFEVVRAPQQTWGLTVVMAIIAGNVLAFLIVAFFFLYATDSSFIDNAWHTIAQISQSEDVKPILERAKLTSDKDIEEWLRGHEPSEGKIGHIKDFFRDIGRMFSQREPEERYIVKNGVFTKVS